MKQEETKFKERVLRHLKKIPFSWVLKTQEMSRSGVPDILMCVFGHFVAIELKTKTGRVSKLQEYNLQKIIKSGGVAVVMDPDNMDAVIQYLNSLCMENSVKHNREIYR